MSNIILYPSIYFKAGSESKKYMTSFNIFLNTQTGGNIGLQLVKPVWYTYLEKIAASVVLKLINST